MGDKRPFRVFVAMPGDYSKARWSDAQEIREAFFGEIRTLLEHELGQAVEMVIEAEKTQPGSIYSSMFNEAWLADAYIADLTQSNANVFLELGIRWALRDRVTVAVLQSGEAQPFNVIAARVIDYEQGPKKLLRAVKNVAKAIAGSYASRGSDSPVRDALRAAVVVLPAEEHKNLVAELSRFKGDRFAQLLQAAEDLPGTDIQKRRKLLEDALVEDESSWVAHLKLVAELNKLKLWDDAVLHARRAVELAPRNADTMKALALALRKRARDLPGRAQPGDLREAIAWYRKAVERVPNDGELRATLGGVLRDLAVSGEGVDWKCLEESREEYQQAAALEPMKTYGVVNVARVELILSASQPALADAARRRFGKAHLLCALLVQMEETNAAAGRKVDFWKWFDLADVSLFSGDSGKRKEARSIFEQGLELVRKEGAQDAPASIRGPLELILRWANERLMEEERMTLKWFLEKLSEPIPFQIAPG